MLVKILNHYFKHKIWTNNMKMTKSLEEDANMST